MTIRRVVVVLIAAALCSLNLIGGAGARASSTGAFTAPYSEDMATWGCTDCEGLSWDLVYEASKADGSVRTSSTIRSPALETDSHGTVRALGRIGKSLTVSKPSYRINFTIDWDIVEAVVSETGAGIGAEVFLDAYAWNAGCACESSSWSRIIQTGVGQDTFSGPRTLTQSLIWPSASRPIKGTTIIRTTLRSEARAVPINIATALTERTATARANGTVERIAYQLI